MGQYCFAGCRLSFSVVYCHLSSSVTLPALGPASRRVRGRSGAGGRALGRWWGGRHCTAGQLCYFPLGRHLVIWAKQQLNNVIHTLTAYKTRSLAGFRQKSLFWSDTMLLCSSHSGEWHFTESGWCRALPSDFSHVANQLCSHSPLRGLS